MKNVFFVALALLSINFAMAQAPSAPEQANSNATAETASAQTPKKKWWGKKNKQKAAAPTEAEKQAAMFGTLETGDTKAVEELVKTHKVDYYAHNEDGETALTLAIKQNDLEKVELLVKRAVINQKNKEGETPLTLAIKQASPDIIDLVAARAKTSLKNNMGETPLYLAIAKGNINLVQQLADRGANLDQKTNGTTPTSQATILNDHKAVSFLLKKGANISLPNDDGTTPLSLAVKLDHNLIAGMLIAKSSQPEKDANWANKLGEPLINIASQKDNPVLVKMLLDAGASLGSTDFQDNTPVHVAAINGNATLLKFLLEQPEADINLRNATGASPLVAAAEGNQQKTYDLLLQKGADPSIGDYSGTIAKTYLMVAKDRSAGVAPQKDENDWLIEAVAMQTSHYRD
jgi:ankyrin repeat protein